MWILSFSNLRVAKTPLFVAGDCDGDCVGDWLGIARWGRWATSSACARGAHSTRTHATLAKRLRFPGIRVVSVVKSATFPGIRPSYD